MKALRFKTYGNPSVLAFEEVPTPEPGPDEVLIKILASGINPSDVKNVAGHFKAPLPKTPGRDYAGVVVAGAAKPGLEVWGSGPGFGVARDGAHAEYIVIPASWIAPKPQQLSVEQAAAVGVPYLAAWMSLITQGQLQAGENVLIVGVSGAVGTAATQIAHWKKARVIGAATRSENTAGADAIINTTTQDLAAEVHALTGGEGADLVLDAVGGAMFEPALRSLRAGGRQIAIASGKDRKVSFDLIDFYHNRAHLIGVDTMALTGPEIAEIMTQLSDGFQQGHLQPPAVQTFSFDRAIEAYESMNLKTSRAKPVLRMPGN